MRTSHLWVTLSNPSLLQALSAHSVTTVDAAAARRECLETSVTGASLAFTASRRRAAGEDWSRCLSVSLVLFGTCSTKAPLLAAGPVPVTPMAALRSATSPQAAASAKRMSRGSTVIGTASQSSHCYNHPASLVIPLSELSRKLSQFQDVTAFIFTTLNSCENNRSCQNVIRFAIFLSSTSCLKKDACLWPKCGTHGCRKSFGLAFLTEGENSI